MPEGNKKREIPTFEWVLWIIMAIVGVAFLFVGINNVAAGDNDFTRCVMFVVVGIALLAVSLSYVIGNLNIAANGEEVVKRTAKTTKTAKKTK